MDPLSVITIGIDPEFDIGPLTIAWHGLTIVLGIGLAAFLATAWSRVEGIDPEPIVTLTAIVSVAGVVGGRLFYVLEHGGPLLGTRGFTFDGGFILAGLALAVYVRRQRLDPRLLDVVALWLPFGVAIGRFGDVINGEHYGAESTGLLAVRNSHPDAGTPNPDLAYVSGGLYEVMLAIAILVVIWPLRRRLPRPGDLAWLVTALFAVGRFVVFFFRDDSPQLALGLNNGQWTSIALLVAVVLVRGALELRSRPRRLSAPEGPR